jgi:hypothetical protein
MAMVMVIHGDATVMTLFMMGDGDGDEAFKMATRW